jgi:hypothetical protein
VKDNQARWNVLRDDSKESIGPAEPFCDRRYPKMKLWYASRQALDG